MTASVCVCVYFSLRPALHYIYIFFCCTLLYILTYIYIYTLLFIHALICIPHTHSLSLSLYTHLCVYILLYVYFVLMGKENPERGMDQELSLLLAVPLPFLFFGAAPRLRSEKLTWGLGFRV